MAQVTTLEGSGGVIGIWWELVKIWNQSIRSYRLWMDIDSLKLMRILSHCPEDLLITIRRSYALRGVDLSTALSQRVGASWIQKFGTGLISPVILVPCTSNLASGPPLMTRSCRISQWRLLILEFIAMCLIYLPLVPIWAALMHRNGSTVYILVSYWTWREREASAVCWQTLSHRRSGLNLGVQIIKLRWTWPNEADIRGSRIVERVKAHA